MPIDPRIIFGLEAPKLADPAQQQAQALNLVAGMQQARQGQQQIQSGEMDLEQRRQDVADEQALRELAADTDGDLDEIVKRAAGRVSQKRLSALAQAATDHKIKMATLAKTQTDTGKTALEVLKEQNQLIADEAATVLDAKPETKQQVYLDARSRLIQKRLVQPNELPAEYPGDEVAERFFASHAGYAKVLEREHKKSAESRAAAGEQREVSKFETQLPGMEADSKLKVATAAGQAPTQPAEQARIDIARTDSQRQADAAAESARHNKEMERLTGQGQLMTDKRARELADLARQSAADARDSKPPTASQQTVASYAARIKQADSQIDSIKSGFWQKPLPNWMRTEDGQAFDQAARNFINAVLRRESGAAIAESEFESAYQQYIPQWSDSPKRLEQKRANRLVVQESFKRAAGKAYEDPDELIKAAGGSVPTAAGQPPTVTTKAQYDALPSGTVYLEDGKKFKKP